MGEQTHLSIGEVLALVQEEFPDVTISKIRFLESQGLLDPERTPSGYRKFHLADIERLQWILTQQRDNFLPLKVIRERLDEWDETGVNPDRAGDPAEAPMTEPNEPRTEPDALEDDPRRAAASLAAASAMEVAADRAPAPPPEAAESEVTQHGSEVDHGDEPANAGLQVGPHDRALTAEELAERGGVDVGIVHDLENYSMIESHRVGPERYYEPEHLEVIEACRPFLDQGIEVRILRMYKVAAEREAGVFEQLVMPLLKQRNPAARARAVDQVGALANAGQRLHAAMLRQALRQTLP